MDSSEEHDIAFRQIYARLYSRVVRYFVAVFRFSQDEAEELAQETFVRVYTHMHEYRGDAQWAFLETVARNVAFNRVRALQTRKRQANIIELDGPEAADVKETISVGGDPHVELATEQVARLRKQELAEAIDELPDRTRQVLRLYLEDLTQDEIAQVLRISVDAVKSRVRDAKKLLRARLGGNDDDWPSA